MLFDALDAFDVWCFGVRTSGKSTTLGILSGDVSPTQGDASIAGHDILTEQVIPTSYVASDCAAVSEA